MPVLEVGKDVRSSSDKTDLSLSVSVTTFHVVDDIQENTNDRGLVENYKIVKQVSPSST